MIILNYIFSDLQVRFKEGSPIQPLREWSFRIIMQKQENGWKLTAQDLDEGKPSTQQYFYLMGKCIARCSCLDQGVDYFGHSFP